MQYKFSPSVNIIRDADTSVYYVPTPNANRIFKQMANDYNIGIHTFNIIGSYGTGKSSFLVALQHTLNRKKPYFPMEGTAFDKVKKFRFIQIVGEYRPIKETILDYFGLTDPNHIWAELDAQYQGIAAIEGGLVIIIDEFGKFLEYAAENNPAQDLYFIQQLAEYANDQDKNILFITTLHQNFSAYTRTLDQIQREEWEKIKGRLKELTFNEPVEQLLNLAANYLSQTQFATSHKNGTNVKLTDLINQANTLPNGYQITSDLSQKLVPFDPLAATVLTLALQQYGQNERSLFTFLRANNPFSLNDYNTEYPYYNLVCVYDYLRHNYYNFLSSAYNATYLQWQAIQRAIERVEATFSQNMIPALHVVKIIGLLNIFAPQGAKIDSPFLEQYSLFTLDLANVKDVITELTQRKIIRFVNFKQSYILFEGTDLNIEVAVIEAAQHVEPIRDIVVALNKYFDFPYLLAKAVSYKKGTPRFFEFRLSEEPVILEPEGVIDGFINLIFSEHLSQTDLQTYSAEVEEAILYGWYRHTKQIKDWLFEIEKVNYLLNIHQDDAVAARELEDLRTHYLDELNKAILESLYNAEENIIWIFKGDVVKLNNQTAFNSYLSHICEVIYPQTPIFRNELVNRHKLSISISTARGHFLRRLVARWHEENLAFNPHKFPPQRTIYLTLLKRTGIHRPADYGYTLGKPTDPTFEPLWQAGEKFLNDTQVSQQSLQEFVEKLLHKPFKLKRGFLNFWLPLFIFTNRDQIALYHKKIYVPEVKAETLELVRKEPHNFQVKAFDLTPIKQDFFNQYRTLAQQNEVNLITNESFVETVKPFLTMYKRLPTYTQKTTSLSKEARRLRRVISKAKNLEKLFFEDLPRSQGYDLDFNALNETDVENYIQTLEQSIKKLNTCFPKLTGRFKTNLLKAFGYDEMIFPAYREAIIDHYRTLKVNYLEQDQKAFYNRLKSVLLDEDPWLESLAQGLMQKGMRELTDRETILLFERLHSTITALNNLRDIHALEDTETDLAIKIDLTTQTDGYQAGKPRYIPKPSQPAVKELINTLKTYLNEDDRVNIAALVALLKERLQDESS